MLIVCPSCASEYTIDPARIGADGRTVRCAACRETWFVPPEPGRDAIDPLVREIEASLSSEAAIEQPLSVEASSGRVGAKEAERSRARTPGANSALKRIAHAVTAPVRGLSGGLAIAALCLALGAAALAGRTAIVAMLPATARLYAAIGLPVNLRGLDLRDVRSELVMAGSDTFLVVEGEVANVTGRTVAVPSIEIAVRGGEGPALYVWTNEPPRKSLEARESARFRARLAAPPAEARQVLVRFAPPVNGAPVASRAP